jgi:hypothetical protein
LQCKQKLPTKNGEISCFEVLEFFFLGLETSSLAWNYFIIGIRKYIAIFDPNNQNLFLRRDFSIFLAVKHLHLYPDPDSPKSLDPDLDSLTLSPQYWIARSLILEHS